MQQFELPKLLTNDIDVPIDEKLVSYYINYHMNNELPRYTYLMNMYLNDPEINELPPKQLGKPDNRIAVNYPKMIVDTFAGYFMGIAVKKQTDSEQTLKAINEFDNFNDMDDEDTELLRVAAICGRSYQYMFQDEEAETRTFHGTPLNTIMVYTDLVRRTPLLAINYTIDKENKLTGTLYTRDEIIPLTGTSAEVNFGERELNPYGRVPVNEFILNEQRTGLFESAIPLINAFNKALSEKANDVEYFSDSYLKILGAEVDEETMAFIRDNRVINIFNQEGEKPVVEFLDKPDSDAQTENLLNRIERLIFHTCMIANISDENFGNASGTSLAYKLEAQSNLALSIQRKFTRAFNRRYKLFLSLSTNVPVSLSNDWKNIKYKFTRNEPKNLLEETQVAQNLMSITSEETALSALSIIDDPVKELARKEKEDSVATNVLDFQKE